ncbi:MAG: LacI family DNA-binding transcriptional regulator [Clostridia bacterium]|nr:LacI family DNA-binding transcriptional regulator [Clostridia bacterium]
MMTLKEFSAACGLSPSTVSKALNGYPDISEETRSFVREKAAQLGYHPNALARGLKSGRTWNLGVLYTDATDSGFTHNYFSPVLEAFKSEAEKHGYDITFITNRHHNAKMTYLEHCMVRNLDGICIVNAFFDDPEVVQLIQSSLPLVTIDHIFNNRSCIQSCNREGMTELVRYVAQMGHKRIAYIHGEMIPVTEVRLTSFLHAMMEAGLQMPDEYLVDGRFHNPEAAREATKRLLQLKNRPTCIFMPDDYAALGGMEAIREAGLKIPDDISVVGYDGVPLLQLCSPRMTTMHQDTATIGREAALQLIRLIEQPKTTLQEVITVPSKLWAGETVCPITD